MSELSQTINIRTTFDMKKRILDHADKKGMNQSEFIIYAVESFLNGGNNQNPVESKLDIDNSFVQQLQEQLATTTNQLRLIQETMTSERKSILQEAVELAQRMATEKIQQVQNQAIRVHQERTRNDFDGTNQQIKVLQERLYAYETPLLKEVFMMVSQNPQIRDYPDVVYFLVHCYSQQFKQTTQYAIGQ
ncbi:hypothetical protein LV89_00506 [Arcicella aurantiaca]|uniref:Uncharacterized protein n=1 Tax=Arcicella aurantiaca TaxID=591202 RepID=A0A316EDE9_9BACT|nr:hypothetical protein [Arcicella aurantiaca]PWK28953.1 hypothetical protein LV89_00506 [Arcicella aurantiaca]